jgi:hypothetical protein
MIAKSDFVNGVYEDRYVRFYLGSKHDLIKIPHSSNMLVIQFADNTKMKVINKYRDKHMKTKLE